MPRQLFTSGIAVSSNQPEIRKRYNAQNLPYASKAEVFADNDANTFYLGQTFFISDGNDGVQEYWFESGVASVKDLVLKNPESTRIVDSLASLKALDDLKLGDYVRTYGYHAGSDLGGGLFRVTDDNYQTVLLDKTPNAGGYMTVPAVTIGPGTVFKMRFTINSYNQHNANVMELKDVNNNRLTFRARTDFRLDVSMSPAPPTPFEYILRDAEGNIISNDVNANRIYGDWLEAEIRIVDVDPVTGPFTSDLIFNGTQSNPLDLEVQWFEINGSLFPLDEGTGSTIQSDDNHVGTISGAYAWGNNDPTEDGVKYVKAGNEVWLTKQIPNNTVTPFDYGAYNNETVTDYTHDSTAAIQAAINSGYHVEIPPSRLYISSSIEILHAVQIKMSGSFMPMNDSGHEIDISDDAHTTTIIYSDQNIDYIIVRSRNVEIHNGLLYTFNSFEHSKAAILFDTSYPMWRTDIVGVNVYGNQAYLKNKDLIGTTAFKINQENPNAHGYLVEGHIDGRAYWCHKGVELPALASGSNVYVNTMDFTVTGFGCQVYYDFAFGGLFNVKSIGQDANVLPDYDENSGMINPIEDPKYTAFQFHNCSYCTFDVFLADPTGVGSHNGNNYSISGNNNTLTGLLLQRYVEEDIELYGVEGVNRNAVVIDPKELFISKRLGFISELDNAIAFAGNEGNVSYLGYKAASASYFDGGHTDPSSDYIASGSSDVTASTDVTIYSGTRLLTNTGSPERCAHSIAEVADRDLHFAEIVIRDLQNMQNFANSALRQLLLKKTGPKINAIECILHFENINNSSTSIEQRKIVPHDAEYLNDDLFNLFGYRYDPNQNNDALRMVIIRLIGQEGSGNSRIFVHDIALESKVAQNKPNLNIGGGQTIYGSHSIAEQLSADEFRYTNKPLGSPTGNGFGGGYGGEVLQLKSGSRGAIGLYKLNSNDDTAQCSYGSGTNVVLSAGVQSNLGCSVNTADPSPTLGFSTNGPLTAQNGSIDVLYRLVNADTVNVSLNRTNYITRLFADGIQIGEVVKSIRSNEKIESISFPVTADYPYGTVFSVTVEPDRDGLQIGNASFASQIRVTKSFLVPRPGASVADVSGTTVANNENKINELLGVLRAAGFIS